jgi:predicted Mrr-cat superfamily restriction endonuclease
MSTKKSESSASIQVRIAVANIAADLVIETNSSITEMKAAVAAALSSGSPLTIQDSRGHEIIVAGDKIGFVDIGIATDRRVGFGAL